MDDLVPITPQTKVGELLDAYPELEGVLVNMAPPFKRLRNPVLRRTIARVATLERAASIAEVPLPDLLVRLRQAAGHPISDLDHAVPQEPEEADELPAWVDTPLVAWTIDADEMMERGEQPLGVVQSNARNLTGSQLGLINSSFRPGPLIDLLEGKGHRVACLHSDDGFATYIAASGT